MNAFLIWLETSALSVWVRESPSVFAFPTILSFHTLGMGITSPNSEQNLRTIAQAHGGIFRRIDVPVARNR